MMTTAITKTIGSKKIRRTPIGGIHTRH
jgi:hypothetical protein